MDTAIGGLMVLVFSSLLVLLQARQLTARRPAALGVRRVNRPGGR